MPRENLYLKIDLDETGRHLERLIRKNGYSVKEIQGMLGLSCPQPIYRWMKGQILPSVEHLYALSKLLQMPMEELLISPYREITGYFCRMEWPDGENFESSIQTFLFIDTEVCAV